MSKKATTPKPDTFIIELGEYNSKPMIVIKSGPEDKWPLQFGMSKAKKIVACIASIQKFVATDGKAVR